MIPLSQEIIDAYQSGMSMHECAKLFGIPRTSLSYKLKKQGIRIKQKDEIIAEKYANGLWRNKDVLVDMYETQKMSTIQIAEKLGCDKSVVVDWLKRFDVKMRTTTETQKGKEPGNKGLGKRNSEETILCACGCGTRIKRYTFNSYEVRFATGHRIKGKDNPQYKPDNQKQHKRHDRYEYREWRKQVLQEDNYTCVVCGQIGKELQAHHVLPFALFKEQRFDATNGRVMCKSCHTELHKFSREILKCQ